MKYSGTLQCPLAPCEINAAALILEIGYYIQYLSNYTKVLWYHRKKVSYTKAPRYLFYMKILSFSPPVEHLKYMI